jgi:adenylate cyclase class 2
MIEIEVKMRIDNMEEIEKKLNGLGAIFTGVEHHVDTYYNAPYRDFSLTDEALRIRRGEVNLLTYKGPKFDEESKSRKEIEIRIDDPSRMDEMMLALGYERGGSVVKKRRKYKIGEVHAHLDEVNGLGDFIELETHSVEDEFESRKENVFEISEKLGFGKEDTIRASYLELILDR